MRNLLLTAIIFLLPAFTFASPVANFSASYAVYKNGFFLGNSKRTLKAEKNILNYSAVTETAGIAAIFFDVTINEISKLTLKDNKLGIHSYTYDEKNGDKRTIHQLYIDKTGKLFNSYTKENYPITSNLHDGLGFSIAMMADLKKGLRDIKYTIAEKEKLKDYHIKYVKEEILPSDSGGLKTIKIEHTEPGSKNRFTFWCAPSMGFLPVIIQNVKNNGDEVLLKLTDYNNKAVYLYTDEDE